MTPPAADPPAADPPALAGGGRSWLGADAVLRSLCAVASAAILLSLVVLVVVLARASWPTIREYGPAFLTREVWRPNEREVRVRDAEGDLVRDADDEVVTAVEPAEFGALAVIYGTAVSSAIALLFAVPLSFGAAIFLVRLAPRLLVPPVSFLIEFLAAIPSIAYGIWGLFVLAPFLQGGVAVWGWLAWLAGVPGVRWLFYSADYGDGRGDVARFVGLENAVKTALTDGAGEPFYGAGWLFYKKAEILGEVRSVELGLTGRDMLCGGLILAIMVIPIITALSRDILGNVPRGQIEGTVALGATWWQSVRETLRFSRSALFGAVMLGLARAAGETMAVTLVIGNNLQIVPSPFAPAATMSSLLANEFAEASAGRYTSALVEVALALLLMSLVFNVVARYLVVGGDARTSAAH